MKYWLRLSIFLVFYLILIYQVFEIYHPDDIVPLIEISSLGDTHTISFNTKSNTCIYTNPSDSYQTWSSQFFQHNRKKHYFTVQDPTLGPEPSTLHYPLISSIESEFTNSLINTSYIQSGFNLPINENNPGQYFWWLYPEQIRISWTESENQMRVTWVTFLEYSQRLAYRPILCDEIVNNTDWAFLEANISVFDVGEDLIRLQYIHDAVISGLNSGCSYEYFVGSTCFWSNVYSFRGRTPYVTVNESNADKHVSMIVIGDWGAGIIGTYSKTLLEDDIANRHYDGVLHLGDFAYDLNGREGRQGDDWLNMVQGISSKLPYMTVPGNHEKFYNMSHYSNRFKMPKNDANEGKGWFYSFNFGPVHFIMFNTEQYFLDFQQDCILTHKNWLINDLKQANLTRDEIPWIILLTHHSFYCSVPKIECLKQADVLKADLEDLLNDYKVDIVFQAHVHNYERDASIYKEKVQGVINDHYYIEPTAPVYVINGNAGNYHGHNDPFPSVCPEFFIFGSQDYGYGRLNVKNRTHIYYEQFSAEQMTEIDYFWLIKHRLG